MSSPTSKNSYERVFTTLLGGTIYLKKRMCTFFLFISIKSYAISESKLVCILMNKLFKHIYD
jgi:hypothetical protein